MKHFPGSTGDWQRCPGYAKQVLLTESDLHAEGTRVQFIEIPPRTSVADLDHKRRTEVFQMIGGRGSVVFGGRIIQRRHNRARDES